MTRPTVRSTYRERPASVPLMGGTAIGAFLLIAVLGSATLMLSLWWFKWRVNAEAEIRQDSFNRQALSQDQVVKLGGDLAEIDVQLAEPTLTPEQEAVLDAQRDAIAAELCTVAARVNNPTPEVARIIGVEC